MMPPAFTVDVAPDRTASAARCRAYAAFGLALRPPRETAEALAQLEAALRGLPYPLLPPRWQELPAQEELQRRYTELFEASGRRRSTLSLHESDLSDTPRSRIWEDLIRFYEHFGLQYDGSVIRLWPDHLLIELECLHYLAFLESGAAGDPSPLQRAQRDFLDRHLLAWLPRLTERLARLPEAQPYANLAALLQHFLSAEHTWLTLALDRPLEH